MVRHLSHVTNSRQAEAEMTLPASGVLANAATSDFRIVKNRLDPAPEAGRGLRFGRPNWFQDLQHQPGVDPMDGR